jgi:hypothetical protein
MRTPEVRVRQRHFTADDRRIRGSVGTLLFACVTQNRRAWAYRIRAPKDQESRRHQRHRQRGDE